MAEGFYPARVAFVDGRKRHFAAIDGIVLVRINPPGTTRGCRCHGVSQLTGVLHGVTCLELVFGDGDRGAPVYIQAVDDQRRRGLDYVVDHDGQVLLVTQSSAVGHPDAQRLRGGPLVIQIGIGRNRYGAVRRHVEVRIAHPYKG